MRKSARMLISLRATPREKTPGTVLLAGVPAKPVRKLDDSDLAVMRYVAQAYTGRHALQREILKLDIFAVSLKFSGQVSFAPAPIQAVGHIQ